ncbi:MAG: class I SAM-dependent methyltransferase [Pirellulales bacterium]|nr:class I SAM-dependent methyltransferase [Pirellulales bacterium]
MGKVATGEHHHGGRSSEEHLDKNVILGRLEIIPGQTILDAGCGNGYMSKEFSQLVGTTGRIYAIDPDETSITALRKETEGMNILATATDVTTMTPLPPSAFDLVYLSMVFHGFSTEQIQGFETEVNRLLKSRGKLAIVEIAKRDTPFGPPLRIRYSPEELKQALRLIPRATVDVGEHCYMQLFEKED